MDTVNQIVTSDNKSPKGDGINAVLSLLQELRTFKEKVDKCIEAQSISEYKSKFDQINSVLDKMYTELIGIASAGVGQIRQQEQQEQQQQVLAASNKEEKSDAQVFFHSQPTITKIQ